MLVAALDDHHLLLAGTSSNLLQGSENLHFACWTPDSRVIVCMSKQQHSAAADLHKQILANANAGLQTTAQLSVDLRKEPQKVCIVAPPPSLLSKGAHLPDRGGHELDAGPLLTSSMRLTAGSQSRVSAPDRLGAEHSSY